MILSPESIKDVYTTAIIDGHVDPVGLLARMQILSGFDTEKTSKTGRGLALTPESEAEGEDLTQPLVAVKAAVRIDNANFADFESTDQMHIAAVLGEKAARKPNKRAQKLVKDIDAARSKVLGLLGLPDFQGQENDASRAAMNQEVVQLTKIHGQHSNEIELLRGLPTADIDPARERLIDSVIQLMDNTNG